MGGKKRRRLPAKTYLWYETASDESKSKAIPKKKKSGGRSGIRRGCQKPGHSKKNTNRQRGLKEIRGKNRKHASSGRGEDGSPHSDPKEIAERDRGTEKAPERKELGKTSAGGKPVPAGKHSLGGTNSKKN